jgi:hypothetical protein
MRQNIENDKKGIKTAIIVLSVVLLAWVLFFCYEVFYPYFSKFIETQFTKPDTGKISGEIKDNEEGYIRDITDINI